MLNPLKKGDREFIRAIIDRDYAVFHKKIKSGQDVNILCRGIKDKPVTALITAIEERDYSCALSLLEARADINQPDGYGRLPLVEAAFRQDFSLVRMLIRDGVRLDEKAKGTREETGYGPVTALECAFRNSGKLFSATIMRDLIMAGARPFVRDENGREQAVIFHAIRNNDTDLLGGLVFHGHHRDIVDEKGKTPLEVAVGANRYDVARLLLDRGVAPGGHLADGRPLLTALIEQGRFELVRKMIEKGADTSVTNAKGESAARLLEDIEREKKSRAEEEGRRRLAREEVVKHEKARKGAVLDLAGALVRRINALNRMEEDRRRERGRWVKTSGEEVSRVKAQPLVGRDLRDVFNFRTRERVSAFVDPSSGRVEAVTVTGFDDMKDKTLLEEALEEFQKQGGNADRSVLRGPVLRRDKRPLLPERGKQS